MAEVRFASKLQKETVDFVLDQIEGAVNFRATFAEAIADFPVGTYFTSSATGTLRMYLRTATSPFYVDQGDGAAPVSKRDIDNVTGSVTGGFLTPTAGPNADGWVKLPGIYKLLFGGSGVVTIDTRNRSMVVTPSVAVYDTTNTTEAYPFFEGAYQVRATLTGTATAEII